MTKYRKAKTCLRGDDLMDWGFSIILDHRNIMMNLMVMTVILIFIGARKAKK